MGQCDRLLRMLFETMDEGVLFQEAGGTISLANPAASRILGLSPEELLGRTLDDPSWQTLREDGSPLAPEDRPCPVALRTGRPVRDVVIGVRIPPQGEVRWLLVNAVLERRPDTAAPVGVFATLSDVTERRRAEAARGESEALLRAVTDANPSPIFTKDLESRWTFANPALLRVIGKSREEVLGRTDAEIYADQGAGEALMAVDRRVMESRVQEVVEETVLTPEGRRVFLSIKAPLFDREGRVVGTVGGARDITERKRAEEALRQRERYLETLLRTALDAIWVISSDGAFVDVNEAACEMVGMTRERMLASCAFDLVDPGARPLAEVAARLMRLGRGGGERFSSWLRHRDGRSVDVDVAARHLDFEDGRIVCFLRDVTGSRRAAEVVAQNERRFRALIEKSSDATLVLDDQGRIQFWSPSASRLTGWPGEAMLGRYVFEQVHPDDQQLVIEQFARVTSGPGNVVRQLFRYLHQDGSWRHFEACGRNLLDDPAVRGVVVNSRDVTEQRAVEEQLRQAQKLESVGRLAGGVAHDFNNQLTVILGCCEALEADLLQGAPASIEDVRSIQKAGQHARDLTSQLLAFARKQVVAPVDLDLNVVVREGEKLLRRLLREDVALHLDLAPGPCGLRGDRSQLEQVVFNLVVNARDAMPAGGRLTVETRLAGPCGQRPPTGAGRQDGDFVRLIVRDTGAGIAPEHRAHLFEPFFTTKELGQGTGLGLATVYGIVDQMGGHFHVETEPGQGSTFVVCLPHHAAAPKRPVRPLQQQSRGGSETLLLVEDEHSVRNMLERALRSAGYRVLLAADGEQGLEIAGRESGPIDLVVCDVVMPGMSGPEMVERLHRERGALRVLHVSGYSDDGLAELQRPGCSVDFLAKPFSIADLLRRVRKLLDARIAEAPGSPEHQLESP